MNAPRALAEDFGHALRSLRRAPSFVALAAVTLALGIGATTAIFSVVNGVLLEPLPYPDADRLVVLGNNVADANHSEPEVWDLTREVAAFSAVAAYREGSPVLGSAAEPERIPVIFGMASLIPALGVVPELGRTFSADEDQASASDRVVVISHGLWNRAFGADRAVLGKTLRLEDVPHTIIGVMPAGFSFPAPGIEAWAPLRLDPIKPWERNNHYLTVVARLAPGVSVAGADAQLQTLAGRSTAAYPQYYPERLRFTARRLQDQVVGEVRLPLLLLLGAVVGVLLISSVNSAALFLARGEGRRGEVAVRTALGASPKRVATQLVSESLVVALVAGVVGTGLAVGAVALLKRLSPPGLVRLEDVSVSGVVLLFGLGTALLTGLCFGVAPAWQALRTDVRDVLSSISRSGIGTRRSGRFRRGLVVAQLCLATMLALGAGLLIKSFVALRHAELGFEPAGALAVKIAPSASRIAVDTAAAAFYRLLEDRIAALPGVTAVGSGYNLPLADGSDNYSIQVEGRLAASIGEAPAPGITWVTPGYFPAMGIALRRGRAFDRNDHAAAPLVVMVNQRLAGQLWPGEDAIGKRLRMYPEESRWMTVVGIVADVKHYGIRGEPLPMLYVPHLQGYATGGAYYSPNRMNVVVRTGGSPALLTQPVRGLVAELAPGVPITRITTLDQVTAGALSRERFTLSLLVGFAALALLLAAIGVYGVIAQSVAARTREIGLRMAVGANRGQVARGVIGEGIALALAGTLLGVGGGAALSQLMRGLLYQVSPIDPVTYLAAVPVLALTAAAACALPALRAARLDPMRALRDE